MLHQQHTNTPLPTLCTHPCRTYLIDVALKLLDVLNTRRDPCAANYDAWVAAGSPEPGGSAAAGTQAVQQLAEATLNAMSAAQAAMHELVGCLVEWMGAMHGEVSKVQELLKGPSDRLKGVSVLWVGAVVCLFVCLLVPGSAVCLQVPPLELDT